MRTNASVWTPDRTEAFRNAVANDDLSSSQLAERFWITRNSAVSKAKNLGLRIRNGKRTHPKPVAIQKWTPGDPGARFNKFAWTPQKSEILRRKFREGLAVKRIAREMHSTPATLREKIRMLGLVRLGSPIRSPKGSVDGPRDPIVRENPFVAIEASIPISIADLDPGRCHWPLWAGDVDFEDKRYCGAVSPADERYCAFHGDLGTNPQFRRQHADDGSLLPSPRGETASRLTGSFV